MALARGFAVAGIATAAPSRYARELHAWLAAGRAGDMDYMKRDVDVRLDVRRLIPDAVPPVGAVLMVGDLYSARGAGGSKPLDVAPDAGRLARYVRGRDYHRVIKKRLHDLSDALRLRYPGARFRTFVDTAPVLERELAARAGLGWMGKHTLLIHPRAGSYLLLGGVATNLDIAPEPDATPTPDSCGTCTRCIDACPTRAITPYAVDATRCISYLTIEHRSEIDPSFHAPIGDRLFGCDVCQEVCPHNSDRPAPGSTGSEQATGVRRELQANPAYNEGRTAFDLLGVLGWDEAARRRAFITSALKRVSLSLIRRNAVIAAGNAVAGAPAHDPRRAELIDRLRALAADEGEDELVRRTARVVLRRVAPE